MPVRNDRRAFDLDAAEPVAGAKIAEPQGLPPLLIQVGTDERLLDDAKRYAAAASARGNSVRLELWEGMHHVFQSQTDICGAAPLRWITSRAFRENDSTLVDDELARNQGHRRADEGALE